MARIRNAKNELPAQDYCVLVIIRVCDDIEFTTAGIFSNNDWIDGKGSRIREYGEVINWTPIPQLQEQ